MRPRRRNKKTEPEPISELLEKHFAKIKREDHLHTYQIWTHWEEIVGKKLAKKSAPKSLQKGRLVIVVKNGAWMTQLRFMTKQIRQAVNRVLQKTVVKEIYCTVGELTQMAEEEGERPTIKNRPLTPGEEEEIKNSVQHVADPEVKDVIREIMRKQFLVG
ncbi:DUF721 domain-containing protein [Bdellovibrionota bacterium]